MKEEDKYKGSYWKWAFKDSNYWKFFIVVFGIWAWSTVQTWIQDGAFEPATLFFGIPSGLMVYMSWHHWKQMRGEKDPT